MKASITAILVLISTSVFSVEVRTPDYLIYQGERYTISNSPMEVFFANNDIKQPEPDIWIFQTNKNYVATYEVKDNQLYLVELKYPVYDSDSNLVSKDWITDNYDSREILLDWYSTTLILEPLRGPTNGKGNNFITLDIANGRILDETRLSYRAIQKYKKKLFKKFKNTEKFNSIKEEYQDFTDNEIREFVIGESILDLMSTYENKKTTHNNVYDS